MRVSPIQESFQSGFVGRRVRGRVTSDIYKSGLAECLNWQPLIQGPLRMREGSKYIEAVDLDNWTSGAVGVTGLRCFTFQRGIDEDAIVEIGDDTILVRDSNTGQQIIGGVSPDLMPDFWTGFAQAAEWTHNLDKYIFGIDPGRPQRSGVDFGIQPNFGFPSVDPKRVLLTSETAGVPSGFHGPAIESSTGNPIVIPAGSELLLNEITFDHTTLLLPDSPMDPVIRVSVGTAPGLSDVFTTDVTLGASGVVTPASINFTPGAGNNNVYLSLGIIWTGAIPTVPTYTTGYCDSGQGVVTILENTQWLAPLAGGSGAAVEFPSIYTKEQLDCLQMAHDPGEQVMMFFHPNVEPHRLRLAVGEWTFEALSAITAPTAYQAPTPNNWTVDNQPRAGAYHEGRLYMAGSPVDPATIWASESGDYQNFDNTTPATKADPLLFPLSSAGKIQTLTSRKELVINTDISEVIGTSVAGVIAFDDFSFPKQTDWGSNCIQPIVVGRNMVYTSNSNKKVRTFADEGGTNYGWDGNELSMLAEELFRSPVRRMVYLDEPSYQACFLLASGEMAMATYFYPQDVIGWWKYRTAYNGERTSGGEDQPGLVNQNPNTVQPINQIMDICKINTSEGAKLWMIVNRVGFSGTQKPGHEVLAFDTGFRPALDSCATRLIDPATMTIDDIDELTDQSVNVVIQRNDINTGVTSYTVHPNITVIAGISSPLESWASEPGNVAHVGLFYDNSWQLLPVEGASNRGTAQVSKRRWNQVYMRLNESSVPLINGEPPKDRTPSTPMGTGEPILTGDVEYTELGSTEQGQLEITQDRPIIAEVLALFGKVNSTEA